MNSVVFGPKSLSDFGWDLGWAFVNRPRYIYCIDSAVFKASHSNLMILRFGRDREN